MAINATADPPVAVPADLADPPVAVPAENLRVMSMLHEHVPLALLCDLTAPEGPPSRQILDQEGRPESNWWEQ